MELTVLETGPAYRFSDWPNPDVPSVAAGVYTVWRGEQFIYVGMSGRGWTVDAVSKTVGQRDQCPCCSLRDVQVKAVCETRLSALQCATGD